MNHLSFNQFPSVNLQHECFVFFFLLHHRDIVTNLQWLVASDQTDANCNILFVEHIPSEMFIDLDEIRSQNISKVGSSKCKQLYHVAKT